MGFFSKKPKDALTALNLTIGLTTLAAHQSTMKVWNKLSDTKLTIQIDWGIKTEWLFLFLIMSDRYAFEIGGPKFRDNLQDIIVTQNISSTIKSSFDDSQVKKGVDKEAWHKKMIGEVLGDYNNAEIHYGTCKEVTSKKTNPFNEESILGTLATRINNLIDEELNLNLGMHIYTVATEALVKAQLRQHVEEVYHNHQELH